MFERLVVFYLLLVDKSKEQVCGEKHEETGACAVSCRFDTVISSQEELNTDADSLHETHIDNQIGHQLRRSINALGHKRENAQERCCNQNRERIESLARRNTFGLVIVQLEVVVASLPILYAEVALRSNTVAKLANQARNSA